MCRYRIITIAVVLALTCADAQDRVANLSHQVSLDEGGQFILRWGFTDGTGDIEMELQANCTGWLGIGITAPDNSIIDNIMAGFDDVSGRGYVKDTILNNSDPVAGGTPDGSTDVVLKGAVYHQPWTIVRILRSIFTGDEEDVPIVPGPMVVEWAYSNSDDIDSGHPVDTRGVTSVTFIQQ